MKLPKSPIGQVCKYSSKWFKNSYRKKGDRDKRGIVVGLSRDWKFVRVRWEGESDNSVHTFSPNFITIIKY